MTVKRNIITAGTIAAVVGSALFTIGLKTQSKPQANWNREQWLRLLSGSNGGYPPAPKARRNIQANWRPEQWLRLLSGSNGTYPSQSDNAPAARNGQTNRPGNPAEFIGRTGYALYR
jgi:hypothetical protein